MRTQADEKMSTVRMSSCCSMWEIRNAAFTTDVTPSGVKLPSVYACVVETGLKSDYFDLLEWSTGSQTGAVSDSAMISMKRGTGTENP